MLLMAFAQNVNSILVCYIQQENHPSTPGNMHRNTVNTFQKTNSLLCGIFVQPVSKYIFEFGMNAVSVGLIKHLTNCKGSCTMIVGVIDKPVCYLKQKFCIVLQILRFKEQHKLYMLLFSWCAKAASG